MASAQTAHYSGLVQSVGSGFGYPLGVAVDSHGNVFVANNESDDANTVQEIVAVDGKVSASSQTIDLATSFATSTGFDESSGISVDSHGNVFVANYGLGEIDEIVATDGAVSSTSPVSRLFTGSFANPLGLYVDANENIFISDSENDAVKEIAAAGGSVGSSITTLTSGLNDPSGAVTDSNGDVFFAEYFAGDVKEIVSGGSVRTVASGFSNPFGIALDANGDIFVAESNGGDGGDVKELLAVNGSIPASPTIITVGSGFNGPSGVAVDMRGNVFVADSSNNAVKEIELGAANLGTVAVGSSSSTALIPFTFDTAGTPSGWRVLTQGASSLDFTEVTGSTTCSTSTDYSAGDTCSVAVKFSPQYAGVRTGAVELLGASGDVIATTRLTGIGSAPQVVFPSNSTVNTLGGGFSNPDGVAVDASGNIYVADYEKAVIDEIPAGCTTSSCVKALGGGFEGPIGVAVDGGGNVYIGDYEHSAVKEIPAGCTNADYESSTCTVATLGGGFSEPAGVAVDGSGNVYVADNGNNQVKEIPAGCVVSGCVTTLGGGFSGPYGVAVDGNGNVYVADTGDNAVKEIPAGCTATNYNNGACTITTLGGGFSAPYGVTVDASGNIYVGDSSTNVVKEMTAGCASSSCVTTLGSGFLVPAGVAVDGGGNVYVADSFRSALKEIPLATPPSLSFLTTTNVGTTDTADGPQSVSIANNGNATLTFPLPIAENTYNPSVSADFTWDSSSTCNQTDASSTTAYTLASGASCTIAVDFTPTTGGDIAGSVVLTDDAGNASVSPYAAQTISLAGVGKAITLSPGTITAATVGAAYSQLFTASSGSSPYSYAVSSGSLPTGLSLSSAGTLSGTPTAGGTFSFTVTVTDSDNSTASQSYTLTVAAPAITLTATLPAPALSQFYSQTVTASGGTAPYTFAVASGSLPTGLSLSGTGVLMGTPTAAGTFTFTIRGTDSSSGTGPYASSQTYALTVNQATLIITASSPTVTYGSPVPAITPSYSGFVNGDTPSVLITAPTCSTNYTTTSAPGSLPSTSCSGAAAANYTIAYVSGSVTITQASQTISFTAPISPVTYGVAPIALSASATSGLTVSFAANGPCTVSGSALTITGAGTCEVTASQAGNTDYSAATAVARSITVAKGALTVAANNATRVYGAANPTFTGTVTGQQNGDAFTQSFSTSATESSNVGTYAIVPSVTGANLGDYSVTAENGTLTVTQAGTTTSLGVSSASITPGQSVTLIATVTSATTDTPTGTVAFYNGTTLLGTAALGGGAASYSTAALTVGAANSLTAVYSGDENFTASSTSSAVSVAVAPLDFTMTLTGPASATLEPGGSFSYQLQVSPDDGSYPGTVNFAISGLPPGAKATFSPSSIPANGGPQTVTVTITVPATTAASHPPSAFSRLAPVALAFLLLPFAGSLRRRGRSLSRLACLLLLALAGGAATVSLSGCGAANGYFAQQSKDYAVTITATAGNLAQTATVNVNVE